METTIKVTTEDWITGLKNNLKTMGENGFKFYANENGERLCVCKVDANGAEEDFEIWLGEYNKDIIS